MSRLEGFLGRLRAQKVCLEHAFDQLKGVEGHVLEVGLGHGRTLSHIGEVFSARRCYVIEHDSGCLERLNSLPPCVPLFGDVRVVLPELVAAQPRSFALVHADVGDFDAEQNRSLLAAAADDISRLLVVGGLILSTVDVKHELLAEARLPSGVRLGKYYIYRRS